MVVSRLHANRGDDGRPRGRLQRRHPLARLELHWKELVCKTLIKTTSGGEKGKKKTVEVGYHIFQLHFFRIKSRGEREFEGARKEEGEGDTWSMRTGRGGPLYFLTSSTASYS